MTQSNVNKLANIVSKDLVTPSGGNRIGIVTTIPGATLAVGGTIIADDYLKSDGSSIGGGGGGGGGIGTPISPQGPGKDIFYVDTVLGIGQTVNIDIPNSSSVAYILNQEIAATGDADIIVADGDDFVLDVLGLSTEGVPGPLAGAGGRIRAGQITGPSGSDAPTFPGGLFVTGISTFSGNVSIGGTLTYEDVSNVVSVGIITANSGIEVSGIITAKAGAAVTYYGDGSQLSGISVGDSWNQLDTWLYSP